MMEYSETNGSDDRGMTEEARELRTPEQKGTTMAAGTTGQMDMSNNRGRAVERERVWIRVNTIKADKRDQFEHFVHAILRPAVAQVEPAMARQVRFLHPREANPDGTYTYVFLMDPVVEGYDYAEYEIDQLLKRAYGEVLGQEHDELEREAEALPQSGYDLTQSAW